MISRFGPRQPDQYPNELSLNLFLWGIWYVLWIALNLYLFYAGHSRNSRFQSLIGVAAVQPAQHHRSCSRYWTLPNRLPGTTYIMSSSSNLKDL
jgi:hypothetical protein